MKEGVNEDAAAPGAVAPPVDAGTGRRMRSLRRASTTTHLLWLVLLFVVALVTTTAYRWHRATNDVTASAELDARYAAELAASAIGDQVAALQASVTRTATLPDVAALGGDPRACELRLPAGPFPAVRIDVVDASGTAACSSDGPSELGAYAAAPWFPAALDRTVLEAPVTDPRTGEPSLVVSAPIAGGGAVVAVAGLDALGPSLAAAYGGRRRMEFVVTAAGGSSVIARSIDAEAWTGRQLGDRALGPTAPAERDDLDGVPRLYGRATVAATGWTVDAGLARRDALAASAENTRRAIVLGAAFLVVFCGAAYVFHRRVTRPIRQLRLDVEDAAARRLDAVPVRSGAAEVADLAQRFSELIGERDRELRSAIRAGALQTAIVESAIDCIITIDQDGRILEFNPAAERTFGRRRADVIGCAMDELLIPEELRAAHREGFARHLATGEGPILGQRIEVPALRGDGSTFPAELTVTRVDAPGAAVFTAYLRDLTDRRAASAALAESERRLQMILDNSPALIHMKDLDGRYVFVNRRAEEALGLDREQLLGRTDHELWPRAVADSRRMVDLEVVRSREPLQVEESAEQPDGEHTYLSTTFPLVSGAGEPYGTGAIATDITERKRHELDRASMQHRLNQSQRLESLGQLAGGVAHDFNNLLAVILNYATFVAERTEGTVQADVQRIREAADRAAALTRQLLVFARREVIRPQELDLNEVVSAVRGLLERTIGEHIELRVIAEPDLPRVRADRGQVDQVLLNLAVNARDAMPDGGTLTLETRSLVIDDDDVRMYPGSRAGPHVQLAVSDTGIGMSPEVVRRAFEPFFSTKAPGEGTGLGLATVYGIVTDAGGSVHVYSEPGIGTTVRVNLPAALDPSSPGGDGASPSSRWVASAADRAHGGDETILVVEDEPAMLEVTSRLLTRNGYRVLAAESAATAMALANEHHVHLLLTDSVMPSMSGSTLTELLREGRPDLRVVFMSGYSHGVLEPQRVLEHGVPLIQKPFTEGELLRKVRDVLAGPPPSAA